MNFDAACAVGTMDWFMLRSSDKDEPVVLVRFAQQDGRVVIKALLILGERLDSATLREIPIGRVESIINQHDPASFRHPVPAGVTSVEGPNTTQELLTVRGESFPDEFTAISEALDSFQRKLGPPGFTLQRVKPDPLKRPDGSNPDLFSRQVAEAYTHAVTATSTPAKLLAEESGVPVTTVHRWIRDARLRGHLPPARRGRAG